MIRRFLNLVYLIPWILLTVVVTWLLINEKFFTSKDGNVEYHQTAILQKVELLGKIELVKYHFQEITEAKKVAESIDFKIFKYKPLPDSKAVLISKGEAVGCVDLTKVNKNNITLLNDTLYVLLPRPELCYFKVDLANSRIYDLKIDYMRLEEKTEFMDKLYKQAEVNIRQSALETGILEETQRNAQLILAPLLASLSGKPVILQFDLNESLIKADTP